MKRKHKCLSKKGLVKRAYRGKPTNGYCPNPEAAWASFTSEQLTPLEEVLRFFHVQCANLVNALGADVRLKLLGNVDIAAASTFFVGMTGASAKKNAKQQVQSIRKVLLTACLPYATELKLVGEGSKFGDIVNKPAWIIFFTEPDEGVNASKPAVAG